MHVLPRILIFQNFHEFQRIGETLDAEIKRWAAGKEGNLRALLSTLQYVCTHINLCNWIISIASLRQIHVMPIYLWALTFCS